MEYTCPYCAAPARAAERICQNCGNAYPAPSNPPPAPPPSGPPPSAPPPPPSVSTPSRRALPAALAALAVIVLIGGVGGWLARQDGNDPVAYSSDEVYLEPAGRVEGGFTPSLLTGREVGDMPGPATTLVSPAEIEVAKVKGSDELNYAGARGAPACDTRMLLGHLNADPAVATAWVRAQGITLEELSSFSAGLTPMTLTHDVRATAHVLDGGTAIPRQVVLQQGTAVLVGPTGEPRVRCASGGPLRLPEPVPTPTYVGVAWPGFDPVAVVEITPCEEPITRFVLQDVVTGAAFGRPVGWGVISDFDIEVPTTTTSTTTTVATSTTTTSTTTTTTLPVAEHDASREGTVAASSRLCGAFAAAKAIDGDVTTSWISSSGDGASSTFEWTGVQDEFVGAIAMVSNAANATARRRTDHGFAAVTIQVADSSGAIVFEERVELPGTPDPDVLVHPNVVGRSVRLLLEGHENPSGSGFAEFTVLVAR